MWIYTFTITYTGNNPLILLLMDRRRGGESQTRANQQMTQAQFNNLRSNLPASFAFSDITRVAVPVEEVVV